jgi:hypothetical protein
MTSWCRDPRVLFRRSGRRFVLVRPGRDEVVILEGSAAAAWELMAEPIGHGELVSILAEVFGVDEANVRQDTNDFLAQMHETGAAVPC